MVYEIACSSPVSINVLVKLSVFDIPMDKEELTAHCLAETRTKLGSWS